MASAEKARKSDDGAEVKAGKTKASKPKAESKPAAEARPKKAAKPKAEPAAEAPASAPKSKSKSKSKSNGGRLRITQVRSGSGRPSTHRATLRALGLKRHQQSVVQSDNPAIRGMIFQVRHLVDVEELGGEE